MALEQVLATAGINPADFTKGELEAIEHSVSADGMSVMAAVHKCAPTKSRSEVFSGGNYQWSRNTDGTFNLFDVPVFAKHVRKLGMKLVAGKDGTPTVQENVVNVDEPWLNRAIEINRQRLEQGRYMGALHVRHHPQGGGEDRTEPAGNFVLKYVRPTYYDGAMVPVLYADFVKIPAAIFDRIKAGLLPYRSIESLPPKFEEIDSIALLDTETPWFRLPMLTPGEEIQREVYAATCLPAGSPLRGVAVTGGKALAALCYFAGGDYSEKKDSKPSEDDSEEQEMMQEDGEEGGEGNVPGKKNSAGRIQCDVCGMTHPDDGRHEMDEDEAAEFGDEGKGDVMGKILDALTGLCKSMENIEKRFAAQPPTPASKDAPVTEQGAKESSLQSKAGADEGRLAGLEVTVNTLKRTAEIKAMVAKAMSDLLEYNLSAKDEADLIEKATTSKEPEAVCKGFVETIQRYGTKMPRTYTPPATGMDSKPMPKEEELPELIREYRAKGPEVLARAIKAHEELVLAKELGSLGSVPAKEFIKYRVERTGALRG